MKLSTSLLALVAGLTLSAQAATVTVGNLPGGQPVPIADGNGNAIANGFAAIGTFADGTDFTNIDAIKGAFSQFGDAVSMGNVGAAGLYQGSVTATVGDSAFSGANVYSVIGVGSNVTDASGLLVIDHGFAFVDEPGATSDAIVSLDSTVLYGGTSADPININGTDFGALQVAPVIPEPSSALLGLLGLSFLAFRRRK